MSTVTQLRPRHRGPYKTNNPSPASDIGSNLAEAISDLRAEGWSWTRIAEWSGYTRRHCIRIHKRTEQT